MGELTSMQEKKKKPPREKECSTEKKGKKGLEGEGGAGKKILHPISNTKHWIVVKGKMNKRKEKKKKKKKPITCQGQQKVMTPFMGNCQYTLAGGSIDWGGGKRCTDNGEMNFVKFVQKKKISDARGGDLRGSGQPLAWGSLSGVGGEEGPPGKIKKEISTKLSI